MTQILQRTVLFADLRGSTSLYETLGNTEATTVVTRSVSLVAQIVVAHGGVVVKTLGDGLMAVFAYSPQAVAAAEEMHEQLDRIGGSGGSELGRGPVLKLQVGIAQGEVIEMAGDCFGDAVNVAARLLDHAGDNETLATVSVLGELDEDARTRFRSLDRMQLRGRVEPVHVYLLESRRRYNDMPATAYGDLLPQAEPEGIRLTWLEMTRVFAGPSLPIVLGRSPQATYCIDDTRVSRSHARIDWHGGTFQLTDLSFNGTYVRFDNAPEIVALRRGNCTLHGSGSLGLGASLLDPTAPCVRFEVLRFSDTTPQAPVDLVR
jgi:class 3 adenylate cyclase